MKKVNILLLTIAVCMLVFTACNNETNEKAEEQTEQKNESEAATIKSDTPALATAQTKTYSKEQLPAGVKQFVEKNYAGYAIIKSVSDPLCQGGDAIDVAITKAGAPNFSLIFKTDGSFVQQEEDVPLSTATNKIREVLKANFSEYTAGDQIEILMLADKSIQYLVDLSKSNTTKEVIFTADGTVVCEQK